MYTSFINGAVPSIQVKCCNESFNVIAKLYDKKLTKTRAWGGTETVSNQTFNGPVEADSGSKYYF